MKPYLFPVFPTIMKRKDLDLLDKLIFSYVRSWEIKNLPCTAHNSLLSELFGESEDAISLSILKLEAFELLFIEKIPGHRILTSRQIIEQKTEIDLDIFQI